MQNWTGRTWTITDCGFGWELDPQDRIDFTATGPNSSQVNITVNSNLWAENCTYKVSSTKEQVTGQTTKGKFFTITLTTVVGGNGKLECTEGIEPLPWSLIHGPVQSTKPVARLFRAIARTFDWLAKLAYATADAFDDAGSHNGGWTAEEGGTNAPAVVYEPRIPERRRA